MPHTSLSAISVAATQRPAAPPPAGLERWAPCTSITRTARCGHCLCACSSCKVVKAAQGKHSLANLGVVCFCSASAPSPTAARALFVGTPTARKTRSAWRLQVSCHVPSLPGKWLCLHKARKAARCVQECSVAYGQSEAPEATWADAAVSEGVRAGPSLCYSWYTCASSGASQGRSLAQVCDAAAWVAVVQTLKPHSGLWARGGWCSGTRATSRARSGSCASSWHWWTWSSRSATPGALQCHPIPWKGCSPACVEDTSSRHAPARARWRGRTPAGFPGPRRATRTYAGPRRRPRTRRRRTGAEPLPLATHGSGVPCACMQDPGVDGAPVGGALVRRQAADIPKTQTSPARACRIPASTAHPSVARWCGAKPRLVLLNRVDMVAEADRDAWAAHFAAARQPRALDRRRVRPGRRAGAPGLCCEIVGVSGFSVWSGCWECASALCCGCPELAGNWMVPVLRWEQLVPG